VFVFGWNRNLSKRKGMSNLTDEERLEMGIVDLNNSIKSANRPRDDELRILIFTACYFVLDGVTLTIRRLESHLRSRGAVVKIASTVPDEFTEEQTKDVIIIPGIKIPFTQAGAGYAFGASIGPSTIREIEEFNPNCVHFTVPDLVSLDGIRWCQRNNIPYMATWHSNYTDYLKYYCLEWIFKPGFLIYLQGFYEQMPAVYVPVIETSLMRNFVS
jgi:phosphatidylinositol alpha 1,6-mannosyltransferase